jgi:hypothetical protein
MANTNINPPLFSNEELLNNSKAYLLNEAIGYALSALYDLEAMAYALQRSSEYSRLASVNVTIAQDRISGLSRLIEKARAAK